MNEPRWYKGNIHTHSNAGGSRVWYPNGDPHADSDPATVTRWYRIHGYDFLVLTDHNHRTLFEYGAGQRRFRPPTNDPWGRGISQDSQRHFGDSPRGHRNIEDGGAH